METSIYLAQIFGVFFLVMGVAAIFNPVYYSTASSGLLKDPVTAFTWGAMSLVLGFVIVHAHNIWKADWTVLVTLVGWGALLKGIVFLVFPDLARSISKIYAKNHAVIIGNGFAALVMGVIFSYYGFLMN